MPSLPSLPVDPLPGDLIRRDLSPRHHGAYANPKKFSPGVLVVFCLIGASLALLVWWLFVKRSGFMWRPNDWQDYKASVLRRPHERPEDAVTVFSDGTSRRGGGSSVGTRTVVLGELDTTYTKSEVIRTEKPWRAPHDHDQPRGFFGRFVPRAAEGSVFGRLRGGARSDADTDVVREKMRHRQHTMEIEEEPMTELSYDPVRHDAQARYDAATSRYDPHPSTIPRQSLDRSASKAAGKRPSRGASRGPSRAPSNAPSFALGDDRAAYARPRDRRSRQVAQNSEDENGTDSDDYTTDSDNESAMGLKKGTKAYTHHIGRDEREWVERTRAIEAGGSSTVGANRYRAGSVGSLSSEGSMASSDAGAGGRRLK